MGDRKIVFISKNTDGMPSIEITKYRNLKTKTGGQYRDMPDQLLTDRIVYTKEKPVESFDPWDSWDESF